MTPSGPPIISVNPGTERTLTKADAFEAPGWQEGSFQAVGQQPNQGMAHKVGCYGEADPLEFRFAQNQGTLTFKVAQAMDSKSAAERLEWALKVDGRQITTQTIGFKDSKEMSTPLAGVAVVQLVARNAQPCNGEATALVVSATIKG